MSGFGTPKSRVGIAAIASLCAACSASPTGTGPSNPNPQHYYPPPATAAPRPPRSTPRSYPYPSPEPGNTFQNPGANPPVDPQDDPNSTFALDVDTASWSVARRYLQDGRLPDADSVRVEEYVNAFPSGYTPPQDDAFAIHVDGAPTPFTDRGAYVVRVGLQSRRVSDALRAPVSLTFVIDTSGSMGIENRLETVKQAFRTLLDGLREDDTVGVVQFSNSANVVVKPTTADNRDRILEAIDRLRPDQSTNVQAGLELGFDMAEESARRGVRSRVILASDGVANVGLTDSVSLLERLDRDVKSGVDLVSIGVGMGNFNDALLEQLADRGNGFYAYINDQEDADRVFGRGLTGSLEVVGKDAKVQVEFDPQTVLNYRLIGYENRALPDSSFHDPGVDAGEVGSGLTVTALYEITPWREGYGHLATVRLRWLDPTTGAEQHIAQDIESSDIARSYEEAVPHFRLATTVAAFGEVLRHNPWADRTSLGQVANEADRLQGDLDGDPDVAEFARLTDLAAQIDAGR